MPYLEEFPGGSQNTVEFTAIPSLRQTLVETGLANQTGTNRIRLLTILLNKGNLNGSTKQVEVLLHEAIEQEYYVVVEQFRTTPNYVYYKKAMNLFEQMCEHRLHEKDRMRFSTSQQIIAHATNTMVITTTDDTKQLPNSVNIVELLEHLEDIGSRSGPNSKERMHVKTELEQILTTAVNDPDTFVQNSQNYTPKQAIQFLVEAIARYGNEGHKLQLDDQKYYELIEYLQLEQ